MHSSSLLACRENKLRALRLYCFSYAGGNALAFLRWQSALEPTIEVCAVQLPGHGTRLREPMPKSWPELIEAISREIASVDRRPFAFFGHSLGGLVAFEVARYCTRHQLPRPVCLFVSGCSSPRDREREKLHLLDDAALIESLREFNGTPQEVLENRELMEILLPVIRADLVLAETYEYIPDQALDIPIQVLAGTRDADVGLEEVKAWANETTKACEITAFEGDHFFIHTQQDAVLRYLRGVLQQIIGR